MVDVDQPAGQHPPVSYTHLDVYKRQDSVVKWLREEGKFENTAVLYEGIQGWVSLGHPVVAGDASKTE